MNLNNILNIIIVGALSLTPLSLILIQLSSKIFSTHDSTLAKTTTVCTTMLGTLTKDTMYMQSLIFDRYKALFEEDSLLVSLENKETKEELRIEKKLLEKEENIRYMAITASLCRFHKIHNLEKILTDFFIGCNINNTQIREKYDVITKIPSDENKKLSSTVAINKENKEIFSFSKGHAATILKKCTRMLVNGKKIEIDNKLRQKLSKGIQKLNESGQKTIAFAFKPLPLKRLAHYSEDFTENDLVLLGIAGLGDIINTELSGTIEEIKALNIKMYLLSSTKEQKSIAIGHELKISNPKYFEAIDSETLKDLSNEHIAKMLGNKDKDYIFYLLKDEDKKRIIEVLTSNGEIVALCDGKNGEDLKSILKTIKKERQKTNNYRKLLLHSLSCKLIEIILLLITLLFHAPLALSLTLILVIDIVINITIENTLRIDHIDSTEPNEKGHLLVMGIFGGIITGSIYIWSLMRFGWTPDLGSEISDTAIIKSSTMAFLLLCIIQIINAHNIKNSSKSIFKTSPFTTPYLSLVSIIAVLLIYMITHFEIFRNFLHITTLSLLEWEIIIFAAGFLIIIEEIRKYANSKK